MDKIYLAWMRSLASDNTRRAYGQAMQDSMTCLGYETITQVSREEVDRWMSAMRDRGLSDSTIGQRISAVCAFYQYAEQNYSHLITGNPTTAVRRPKINPYGKANYLSVEEVKALLGAIDKRSMQGRRDYALYLGYLFTGKRNSEWRSVRWGDIQVKGISIFFRWSGKGKHDVLQELPRPVWDAILMLLHSDGREKTIKRDEYLFAPYAEGPRRGSQAHWNSTEPLSSKAVLNLLKCYCRKAGLNPEVVKVHTLRHTASMLREEAGEDEDKISKMLGHTNRATTYLYLQSIKGNCDTSWQTVSVMLGV